VPARFDGPWPFGHRSLCHLRLYGADEVTLAVAIELDDNPGRSVVNAAGELRDSLLAALDVDVAKLALVLFFPAADDTCEETWTSYGGQEEGYRRITRAETESLAGEPITPRQPGPCTARDLWPGHAVLRLIPEDEAEVSLADRLSVVAIGDLPFAHLPARCAHRARYDALLAALPDDPNAREAADAQFFVTLTPDDQAACPYHDGDWRAIADASVALLDGLAPDADIDDAIDLARTLIDDETARLWLVSLVADPIVFSPGAPSVTNGQHRACALRCSGAQWTVAELSNSVRQRPAADAAAPDPTRRACAVLSAFWASRAAAPDPNAHRRTGVA